MRMLSSFSKVVPITLSLTIALLGAGCVADVQARPAYAGYAGYDSYPHTVYHGRTVYYFDGAWHHRHGQGWVHVDETPDLYRYRTRSRHVRNAPDARNAPNARNAPDAYHRSPVSKHSHRYEGRRRSAPSAD
jgi:hypothetical protein